MGLLSRYVFRQTAGALLLILISLAAVVLFIWNIWRRGWVLPILAVGLWGFVAVVVGTIYPAVIQRFQDGFSACSSSGSTPASSAIRRRSTGPPVGTTRKYGASGIGGR